MLFHSLRRRLRDALVVTGLALVSASASLAQTAAPAAVLTPLPQQVQAARPVPLLPADLAQAAVFVDSVNTAAGDRRGSFKPHGQLDGKPLFRADSPKSATSYQGLNVRWPTATPLKKGDVVLGRFWIRAIEARQESGEAEGMFFFGKHGADERSPQTFSVGPDWTLIHMPFVALWDAEPGQAHLLLTYAHLQQTFEIAGIELLNLGQRLKLADLPVNRFSYQGREADAPWRKAALARIDAIRTAPLTIRVVDAAGQPVAGAQVQAELVRPEFLWGTSVSAERLMSKGPDGDRYRQSIIDLFDTTVVENGFKWPVYRQPVRRATAHAALEWLNAQGLRNKGHNLAWPGWKWTPRDIAAEPEQRKNIAALNDAHIRELLAATKGRLIGWDVVNEPVHERYYYAHMPREHVAQWFKLAQASDPKLQLTVNEYAMLNRSTSPLFIAEFRDFVAMLRKQGARVDVLGVQGHVGQTPRPPVAVLSDLDLLAEGGNNIQVTEYDFNTPDEELQADYTRDFLIALYSHEAVSGFIMWGFWQREHWKPNAAMFRADWSEKTNLKVWKDLVLGAWKTRVRSSTTAAGEVAARGHRGQYQAVATLGGKTARGAVELGQGGATLVLKLQ